VVVLGRLGYGEWCSIVEGKNKDKKEIKES
jgi:hypothetical protein